MDTSQAAPQGLTDYEREQLEKIRAWKNDRPDMISRVFLPATIPFSFILYHVVPKRVMVGMVDGFNHIAKSFVDRDDILAKADAAGVEELKGKDLLILDQLAAGITDWAKGAAVVEGAVTGMGGFLTISVDIPVIITLALRTAYKIGLCYGFDGTTEDDKNFILGILAASSAGSLQDKLAALFMLKSLETALFRKVAGAAVEQIAMRGVARGSSTMIAKRFASSLSANIVRRKALQLVPGVGAVIGGAVNGWFMKNVCTAATCSFQRRWLSEKYSAQDIEKEAKPYERQ